MVVSEEEFNNDIDAIALDSVNNDTMADSKEDPVGENEVSNKMVQSYENAVEPLDSIDNTTMDDNEKNIRYVAFDKMMTMMNMISKTIFNRNFSTN